MTTITKYIVTIGNITAEFPTNQEAIDYRLLYGDGSEQISSFQDTFPNKFSTPPPVEGIFLIDHFISNTIAGNLNWSPESAGSGSLVNTIAGESGHPGIVTFITGNTTFGRSSNKLGYNTILFGNSTITYEYCVRIPVLSNDTDNFQIYVGTGNQIASGDMINGLYFRYNHSLNNGHWTANSSIGCVRTTSASDMPVIENAWHTLRIICDGLMAKFYIDGLYATSINTNIPILAGNETSPCIKIEKTSGINSRSLDLDYFWLNCV
jgi:hypothetical protein